jgi:hypothetical protein
MNKKPLAEKRLKQINVALTESEFQMLQVIRAKHGKSVSELIRESIFFFYCNK